MTWNFSLTSTDFFIIAIFFVLYALFFLRIFWLARQLRTTAWAVIPKFFLRTGALALLLAALLGPSFGEAQRELVAEGKDIYLAVDVSKSMDANDVAPSRLEKVKFELNKLVKTLSGSRFGLLVFSTEAYVHAPLTSDQTALTTFIASLSTRLVPNSGTNLCSAIDLAVSKLLKGPKADTQTKVIVVLTDGEDFGACESQELRRLRSYGIPLYIVGVGNEGGSTIPSGNGVMRDKEGKVVRTRLNRDYLRQLAQEARGSYLEINSSSGDLTALASAIERLENRLIDQRKITVTSNKYYYFLAIALLFISVDMLVSVRTFKL